MITYEYHCVTCNKHFEVKQRITEDALTICPTCGGEVYRVLNNSNFLLINEGWPSAQAKGKMHYKQSTYRKPK